MKSESIMVLAGLLVLCVGGGALIGIFTAGNIDAWYAVLKKPSWTPPNWVFGPAWTVLYALMAIAMWLVWRDADGSGHDQTTQQRSTNGLRLAVSCFAIQLLLNFLWTPVFFGAHRIGLGMLIILALVFAVAITLVVFRQTNRLAAWLLVPYLCWVIYASTLNGGFLALNGW